LSHEAPALTGLEARRLCPVCAAEASPPFFSSPFDDEPVQGYLEGFYGGRLDQSPLVGHKFELCRCGDCGLVFQRWVPNDELLADLYGPVAGADPNEVASNRGLDVRLGYQHDIERVVRHFGPPRPVRVLDFGAGTGLWLQMAAALGCDTTACEFAATAADRLCSLGHETVLLADVESERFDFINSEQVFEHLVEPRAALAHLTRALRSGGVLRISVPDGSDIEKRLTLGDWSAPKGTAASLNCVAPLEHLNCFDHASLTRLASEVGLVPFRFPLQAEVHQTARIRYVASAVWHRIRRPGGTMLYFSRPE
jgi:SAM-dependent methyltransferase